MTDQTGDVGVPMGSRDRALLEKAAYAFRAIVPTAPAEATPTKVRIIDRHRKGLATKTEVQRLVAEVESLRAAVLLAGDALGQLESGRHYDAEETLRRAARNGGDAQ